MVFYFAGKSSRRRLLIKRNANKIYRARRLEGRQNGGSYSSKLCKSQQWQYHHHLRFTLINNSKAKKWQHLTFKISFLSRPLFPSLREENVIKHVAKIHPYPLEGSVQLSTNFEGKSHFSFHANLNYKRNVMEGSSLEREVDTLARIIFITSKTRVLW